MLYDYVKKLQASKTTASRYTDTEVRDIYVALLNVLSCVPPEQAYLFTRLQVDQNERAGTGGVNYVDGKIPVLFLAEEEIS